MIQWLTRRFSPDPGQLGLFESAAVSPMTRELPPPADRALLARVDPADTARAPAPARTDTASASPDIPETFLAQLRERGLRGVARVVLTRNRRTMVSVSAGVLRVHEGFVHAPPAVHEAIATFATSRDRARRAAARDLIVEYPVPIRPLSRRPATLHADDEPMAVRLTALHAQLNLEHFGGTLDPLEIQVSRRLARRLGHYTPRTHTGGPGEIVISRRHVRRDGWPEAIHTLLHEMVHQWQDETGRPVDHGAGFRAKCRAVGIAAAATRDISR